MERALREGKPQIHHSDQGVQYAAHEYVERLLSNAVKISMAHVGRSEENNYAERLMRMIKEEEVGLSDYQDIGDARRQLGRFLDEVYNQKRIHSALGYLTPAEFAEQWQTQQKGPEFGVTAAGNSTRQGPRSGDPRTPPLQPLPP